MEAPAQGSRADSERPCLPPLTFRPPRNAAIPGNSCVCQQAGRAPGSPEQVHLQSLALALGRVNTTCSHKPPRPVHRLDSRTPSPAEEGPAARNTQTSGCPLARNLQSPPALQVPAPAPPSRVPYLVAFPRGTSDVIGGSRCLIHVRRKLGADSLPLKVPWRVEEGKVRVSRRRGGSSLCSHDRAASPRGRFPWGPPPRDAKPCSPSRRRRSSCWDPEGARPAPAAPRALGPGLPSREIVQDSPDQKREQIQKELRGGARRYVYGEGGSGRTELFPRVRGGESRGSSRSPRPPPPRAELRLQGA